jgi:hypothetical protein
VILVCDQILEWSVKRSHGVLFNEKWSNQKSANSVKQRVSESTIKLILFRCNLIERCY